MDIYIWIILHKYNTKFSQIFWSNLSASAAKDLRTITAKGEGNRFIQLFSSSWIRIWTQFHHSRAEHSHVFTCCWKYSHVDLPSPFPLHGKKFFPLNKFLRTEAAGIPPLSWVCCLCRLFISLMIWFGSATCLLLLLIRWHSDILLVVSWMTSALSFLYLARGQQCRLTLLHVCNCLST